MNLLYKNAIDSICLGVEDFESEDDRRALSCVRNLYAGLLLLFKYRLATMSPAGTNDVLISQRMQPKESDDGNIIWVGIDSHKKTANSHQIQQRLKSLGVPVAWERVESVRKIRNDVEHLYPQAAPQAMREAVADTFIVVRDFLEKELAADAVQELGADCWQTMLEVSEVYERELLECMTALDTLSWVAEDAQTAVYEWHCEECGSALLLPEQQGVEAEATRFCCKSCDARWSYEELIRKAVDEFFSGAEHINAKDGGDPIIADCPECGGPYSTEADVCLLCGFEFGAQDCVRCGAQISIDEAESAPMCGYCSYVSSKGD